MNPKQLKFDIIEDVEEPTGEITLDRLRMANRVRNCEWGGGDKITAEYSAVELAGEVGELLNVIKKMMRENLGIRGSRATINDLEDEFADVLITLDLLAMRMKVDLTESLRRKFNETSSKLGLMTRL